MATALAIPMPRYSYHETNELRCNSTLSSGQFQFGTLTISLEPRLAAPMALVAVNPDTIAQYENTIKSLQEELRQYRLLVISESNKASSEEIEPNIPLSAAGIEFLNSIIEVRIPQSAIFVDFDEGEI
jgi:hypothetical protein